MVFLVGDVDAEAERLRAAGATILNGPVDRAWGHRTLHVEDPDGFVVELAEEIPRQPSHGPTVDSADRRNVRRIRPCRSAVPTSSTSPASPASP